MTSTATALEVRDIRVVSRPEQRYLGWPTIGRQRNGRLMLVSSGGRHRHVCPYGQVHWQVSDDRGETWSHARVLVDGLLDDRDAGVLETSRGTLLVNWFTSLAWEQAIIHRPEELVHLEEDDRRERLRRHADLTDEIRAAELGCWAIRSTDGGVTWSPRINTLVNSPHGPMQLADGRLLYVGRGRATDPTGDRGSPFGLKLGAAVSLDDGVTWHWAGDIPVMPGHNSGKYHELHGVEAADGRIVVHIRNHAEPHYQEILQTESTDGGATWSVPRSLGYFGFPCHLTRLHDDTLLSTFSHRRDPRGNYIILSRDNGRTWSEPQPISVGCEGDFGYPSSVQLDDHEILTAWYQAIPGRPMTQLHVARWRLHD